MDSTALGTVCTAATVGWNLAQPRPFPATTSHWVLDPPQPPAPSLTRPHPVLPCVGVTRAFLIPALQGSLWRQEEFCRVSPVIFTAIAFPARRCWANLPAAESRLPVAWTRPLSVRVGVPSAEVAGGSAAVGLAALGVKVCQGRLTFGKSWGEAWSKSPQKKISSKFT